MAQLEVSSELLFLLRGVLHQAINDKSRSARDNRYYAEMEAKREREDPSRVSHLSSKTLITIADSLEECVQGLQDLHHRVEVALEQELAPVAA